MDDQLPPHIRTLQERTRTVVEAHVAPGAAQVDAEARWPAHSMRAFAEAGLMGLQVPSALGGHGQGLLALSVLTETIARSCPSSALCFGMHCVGTAVIAAKATPDQEERYLRPIAQGRHITTLSLSESGSGTHFYLPRTRLTDAGEAFQVDGEKQFITNGGQADSYVMSVAPAHDSSGAGDFSCLVVDSGTSGLEWLQPWSGFGMRGNSSRGVRLAGARVSKANLLGQEGDQLWYVFEVVAPYFLVAMAGTYVGIAESALQAAGLHLRTRRYAHSGESLADADVLQLRYAEMWMAVEKSRALLREAAARADAGHPDALPYILACKAEAGDTAVQVASDAMTLCGGMAYRDNSRVAQMLRDARASHVMAPTTDVLKLWLGRSLLGVPLL
ncbi:MAG: acyl-CoA dehydrogenase [Comamonadaceae bacterium]|nr:MAG: acyl-CoA dehydrogenase [Comamonadaceae bacterium]